jgi:hypothetical protein
MGKCVSLLRHNSFLSGFCHYRANPAWLSDIAPPILPGTAHAANLSLHMAELDPQGRFLP